MSPFTFKILEIRSRTSFESILAPGLGTSSANRSGSLSDASEPRVSSNLASKPVGTVGHGDNLRFAGGGWLIEN